MKLVPLFILFAVGISTIVSAQTTDTTRADPGSETQISGGKMFTPAQRAARQLKMMEKQLHLTQDQVLQMQVILINETVAMDSLRNSSTGDRRTNGRARRGIMQTADQKINALLTDDQKPLYVEWKQQQRQKMMERRKSQSQSISAASEEQNP
jgi:periplasmic protein CpxP/Spy